MKLLLSIVLSFFIFTNYTISQSTLELKLENLEVNYLSLERDSLISSIEDLTEEILPIDENDSLWIKYNTTINRICNSRELWELGLKTNKMVIGKNIVKTDSFYYPKALDFNGIYHRRLGNMDSSSYYIAKAEKAAEMYGQQKVLADIYINQAIFHQYLDSQYLAVKYFIKADSLYQLGGNFEELGALYFNLANTYYMLDDLSSALSYFTKAAEIHGEENLNYPFDLQAVAIVLIEMDSLERAEGILLQVDKFMQESPSGRIQNLVALQSVQYRQGNYAKSLKSFELLSKISDELNANILSTSAELAVLAYLESDNSAMANVVYQQQKQFFDKDSDLINILDLSIMLQEKYGIEGRRKLADLIDSKDSLLLVRLDNKALELNEKYQSDKKELENSFLKDENEVQNKFIKLQRGAIALFVIGILGLLFLLNYLRKQRNRITEANIELENRNQKIKLFNRELAHRTKNQIALTANLITNQKRLVSALSPRELIEDLECKVQALAEVNKSLLISEETSEVPINPIFKSILENNIYSLTNMEIQAEISGVESSYDASHASQLALVINELSTNSIKYAFENEEQPSINIVIKETEEKMTLVYEDNGYNSKNNPSIGQGTYLIEGIIHQLNGAFDQSFSENGYIATINIPINVN